jgi:glycosyltransferase involved in cell wall biosynthesis
MYCSDTSRAQHQAFGFYSLKGSVLENGFDTRRFVGSQVKRAAFRSKHGFQEDHFIIGNVARYDPAKGHTYLLQAFRGVVRDVPKARLVLIGRGVDQANQNIFEIVRRLGIANRVLLLGEQESLEDLYPGLDLYCSASIAEGFPNAVSEAMACEVPCVATDTGASRQLVEGVGGVVPVRGAQELSAAIVEIARLSEDKRRVIGRKSRERIVTSYSLEAMLRKYGDTYRGLVERSN